MKREKTVKKKAVKKKVEPKKETSETKGASGSAEKVFDVAHPGKSMPSSSSRPIIVSHKPSGADPMVSPKLQNTENTEDAPSAGEGTEMVMSAPKKNRIEPLHTDIVPDDEKVEEPAEEKAEAPESPNEEDATESTTQPDDTEDDDVKDEISDVANEVTTKKEVQSEAAKKEADAQKRQAEVDALVNNKQYFVPINSVQKRRSMKFVVILLLLVAVAIGVLVALDAELFDIGITPPTDFL